MKLDAGDCCLGLSARSTARAKLAAVTRLPSEKWKFDRTVNVYRFPSREIVGKPLATSGRSRLAAAPDLSG